MSKFSLAENCIKGSKSKHEIILVSVFARQTTEEKLAGCHDQTDRGIDIHITEFFTAVAQRHFF
jgi:hypothetical protein